MFRRLHDAKMTRLRAAHAGLAPAAVFTRPSAFLHRTVTLPLA
jgi:hypothetical protein